MLSIYRPLYASNSGGGKWRLRSTSGITAALCTSMLCLLVAGCADGTPPQQASYSSPTASGQVLLQRIAAIDLPGSHGKRFDYLTYDPDDHYILSAHLGAGLLYVIDTKTNALAKTIPDVPGIEGIAYIPAGKKAYTSDWYENKVGVVDLQQMKVVKRLPTEDKPDGIAYAEPFHKAYVSDEQGKAVTVIDTDKDEIAKTLQFDSETGVPLYDPVARKVYVNLQDQNLLAVLDPMTDAVTASYPVRGCEGNHGMALDAEHHRVFLACEGNNLLAVFNLDTYKVTATVPLPSGVDVVQFDASLGRIYAACYSGFLSVIQQDDPDHYRKLEDVPVQPKVHSLGIVPDTHRLYVPEEEENGNPTSKIIVYGYGQ